jgi:molybdopterin/thiamine biosynthesis adenylyltransferase/rhodanese-related sulfurtransferase
MTFQTLPSPGRLPDLQPDEITRYSRHLIVDEIGVEGQRRLKGARVLIIGAGGLGSPVSLYLAAAGVGRLGLVDFDTVDVTNLQRQILYGSADVGKPKLDAAIRRLTDLNPHVAVRAHDVRLSSTNALEILRDYDIVVDGTDNFAARYLTNDACIRLGIPNVYGSIQRFEGQVSVFTANDGPCYRCLFPEPPPPGLVPSCAEAGVLGVLPGMIGTIQATEVIKLIVGAGTPLIGRLLCLNALDMQFRVFPVRPIAECVCRRDDRAIPLTEYTAHCTVSERSGANAAWELDPPELARRLARDPTLPVLDVRELHEWRAGHLARATHVPLGALLDAPPALDPTRDVVVICKAGGRSTRAAAFLRGAGFSRVWNATGGMDRYTTEVAEGVTRGAGLA